MTVKDNGEKKIATDKYINLLKNSQNRKKKLCTYIFVFLVKRISMALNLEIL